ncbi:inositol oxygenase isoform X4 [Stigmatopora nigra]
MRVVNLIPDPSLDYRLNLAPETKKEHYRNFQKGSVAQHVYNTYKLMHTNQNVDFVKQKHLEWKDCNHAEMTMMDAIMSLDNLVDESDPDVDFPNSFHAFQTAEGIRKEHPDKGICLECLLPDWFQLVGLIHDVGKVMALWGEPQWAVVGDTFPVGCAFQSSIVFRDSTFLENPDDSNPSYNCKYGIYTKNCGLDNVLMSWGHDVLCPSEYLYHVLQFNKCSIPKEGLSMIRYHSFYPWHSQDDYMYLCDDNDLQMLPWVQAFNKFDLYTKVKEDLPDVESLRVYYQSIIDKYCPGILKW